MRQTLLIKLAPTEEQRKLLLQTMERFNEACNYVSSLAFENKTKSQVKLHKLSYQHLRQQLGLSAQMAVRVIGKVAETYKADKSKRHTFKPHGAITYDQRILAWKGLDRVSILTLAGRQIVPIRIGRYQECKLDRQVRQTDLILRKGIFYLATVVDVPEPSPDDPTGVLGIDLGINNLATDSDGEIYSGEQVDRVREKNEKIKASLQRKGTKSAKRHLKKLSGKEKRFRKNTNHVISKRLVSKAKDTNRLIVLEDLKGIGDCTVKKGQRRRHKSWAFSQLRNFITYKAKLAGIPIAFINPKHTSQACPQCGCVSKSNRHQSSFVCQACGFASNADLVGAINIASRAASSTGLLSRPNWAGTS